MPNFLLGFWYLNSGPHACTLACLDVCTLAQQVLLSTVLVCFQKPLVEERVYSILQLTVHHPEKPRQKLKVETEARRDTASCLAPSACSLSCLSYIAQTDCHSRLRPPTSASNHHAHRPQLMEENPHLRFSLSCLPG